MTAILRQALRESLDRREALARSSLHRLLRAPARELTVTAHRTVPLLPAREVVATLFTGQRMRVVLPDLVAAELYRHGFIEAAMTRVMLERLELGALFVDVGAQYGYHSLVASLLVGAAGRVVAFEPARRTFDLLRRNLVALPNTTAEPLALGARTGTVLFHDFGPRYSALNSLLAEARVPASERRRLRAERYEVPCTTLDGYLGVRSLQPDMVKIDAESSELEVLRGMERTLRDGSPLVTVETGDYGGGGQVPTAACIAYLAALGYRAFEYRGALRPHQPRRRYGYDNLYFAKALST